jgi:hypothetical protein
LKFKQLIDKFYFENQSSDNLRDIALKGIEEGFDSPSLCILAGLEKNETPSKIDYYFQQTLLELDIKVPSTREDALKYAVSIVEEIFAGNMDVIEATSAIIDNVLQRFDFFEESKIYCYDSIDFAKAYGLYYTYDDLMNAEVEWQLDKSNLQLMAEVKNQLLEELKIWKTKMNDI